MKVRNGLETIFTQNSIKYHKQLNMTFWSRKTETVSFFYSIAEIKLS